jgi:hypothetical protein
MDFYTHAQSFHHKQHALAARGVGRLRFANPAAYALPGDPICLTFTATHAIFSSEKAELSVNRVRVTGL